MRDFYIIYGYIKGVKARSIMPFNLQAIRKATKKFDKITAHFKMCKNAKNTLDFINNHNFVLKCLDNQNDFLSR